ncbi:MAG: class I SAM-dependent methyltransferase [Verrucomicrobia bacterium]|nr:class I SAM-dependent methyltransferase [Verrucomicrobiota bacterium]MDE3098673.1 class I SAM-dependent methyltransferase [Verrucomicrobiota bacterium]
MITVQELLADPPKLHAFTPVAGTHEEKMFAPGELINRWKLSDEELLFIDAHVNAQSKTIETGAGCSTVLFAMKGARHTCIVPDRPLTERIVAFCKEHGVPVDKLTFIIEPSEKALPRLEERDFDLALIDGRHGFPQPFMDWYYVAEMLKIGGYVIIDDLHVWVCETLANLLTEEKDWDLVHESLGGCALKKLGNGTQNNEFPDQPYVRRRSRQYSFQAKLRYLGNLLKRRNYPLFASTCKLAVQSALMGKFGERPRGRR